MKSMVSNFPDRKVELSLKIKETCFMLGNLVME